MNKPTHTIEHHTIKLSDSVSMRFCRIPACPEGFLMGSRGYSDDEEPIHRVVIPEEFWMAETPTTKAQYDNWIQTTGRQHKHHFAGNPEHPADNMTWHEALDFCRWLSQKYSNQFPAAFCFAELPCESMWEYACRGNSQTEYHSGDGDAALRSAGWHGEEWGTGSTHPCGQKQPNAFGLYDMHGNVWEWCLDRWDKSAFRRRWDRITDRETLTLSEEFGERSEDPYRVLRGGSSWGAATRCRSAYRLGLWAGNRDRIYGFRVCLVRSPFGQTAAAELERTASQRRDGAEMAGSDGEAEILNTGFRDAIEQQRK